MGIEGATTVMASVKELTMAMLSVERFRENKFKREFITERKGEFEDNWEQLKRFKHSKAWALW